MQDDRSASEDTSQSGTASSVAQGDLITADICVIGAGSGGLSVAAAAVAFGRSVVLIEKHKMGGDCLNYGCVPSKALISSAKRAHALRTAGTFGVAPVEPTIDHRAVHDHVKGVIGAIAPNDSVERFTGLGVRVIAGAARFLDKKTVAAGDFRVRARRFVIATGSSPAVPPIPGLENAPYFTNETIFDNDRKLDHLIVIGGGPIGLEMAQAHLRLGSRVTVLEGARALAKDDPELTAVVLNHLRYEGVEIIEGAQADRIESFPGYLRVHYTSDGATRVVEGSHILVAAGRRPTVGDLNLEAAGVRYKPTGITVDRGLRTSNRRIFAIGDAIGGLQFTHVANYHAGIVIRRALFRLPAKVDLSIVPWVTFTEPELAHVGLSEEQAKKENGSVNVLRWPYHENDRAQAERATDGHVKVLTDKKGRILGATIVGLHAGELIHVWSFAIAQKLKIKAMTDWIAPYPTLGEINKRVAYRHFATAPGNRLIRRIIDFLAWFG
jgi:pyruvate/2-oxoglutarate dehydrogenase complex dihydrolipoamide dehydrogenase (E3) component